MCFDILLRFFQGQRTSLEGRLKKQRQTIQQRRHEINEINARIDSGDKNLELVEEQLSRARMVAPFDGYVVVGDLSQSLGLPGGFEEPRFKEVVLKAEQAVKKAGIPLGTFVPTVEKGREFLDRGYQLLMFAYDGMLIENAITPLVHDLKN